MRAWNEGLMSHILFTAWGYEVSILEFLASVTSLVGVWLGTTGARITWPWWAISSALYGIFFYQANLMGSAALQLVFIVAAMLGWFGWAPTGAVPGRLVTKYRIYTIFIVLGLWVMLEPALSHIGAAATVVDSFLFVGSLVAQILMVYEKTDNWPLWFVVDLAGTILYFTQKYYFTSFLYLVFTAIALIGWWRWNADQRSATRSIQ
jgi:nicotinamide mononucleotide transporter